MPEVHISLPHDLAPDTHTQFLIREAVAEWMSCKEVQLDPNDHIDLFIHTYDYDGHHVTSPVFVHIIAHDYPDRMRDIEKRILAIGMDVRDLLKTTQVSMRFEPCPPRQWVIV